MPELPEVEHFRHILLKLVDRSESTINLECPPPLPTKRFPSQDVFDCINQGGYMMVDVLRKGKVLCVILQKQQDHKIKSSTNKKATHTKTNKNTEGVNDEIEITGNESILYLSLHMGMTGRISSPTHVPALESLSENDAYPPPHTHLIFRSSNGKEASFSDPRRFGSVLVHVGGEHLDEIIGDDSIPTFQDISQDALEASKAYCTAKNVSSDMKQHTIVEKLMNRKKGIKGLLLDQRAVVSGVGNWVADEILYRSTMHPDQNYLNITEATTLIREMYHVLLTAVTCLNDGNDFPVEWLFHRRWRKGGGGNGDTKDVNGKPITFIQSGGRSSAIVPSIQKIMGRKSTARSTNKNQSTGQKKNKKKPASKNSSSSTEKVSSNDESSKPSTVQGKKRKSVDSPHLQQQTRRSKRLAK